MPRQRGHLLHVLACLRILQHRPEVVFRAPSRVIHDASAVEAPVDVGRDESRLPPHGDLGCLIKQADEFIPLVGIDGKTLISVTGLEPSRIVVVAMGILLMNRGITINAPAIRRFQ